jgi:hypothetical protein
VPAGSVAGSAARRATLASVSHSTDQTVAAYAIRHGGVMKGARVLAFITQWTLASQGLGRTITLAEYCDWWGASDRTAWRHLAEFREVFADTGLHSPQAIADQAIARAEALQHGVKGVGGLPLRALQPR